MAKINIVLHEPEIPQNTGNIARTCAATGAALHLIRPLGFTIDDRKLKRAGLDYWHQLDITYYDSLDDFYAKNPGAEVYYFSTKAPHLYTDIEYPKGAFLVFGRESVGLPDELVAANAEKTVRIPMIYGVRCLNLSNAVAVAAYEVLRQGGFDSFEKMGALGK